MRKVFELTARRGVLVIDRGGDAFTLLGDRLDQEYRFSWSAFVEIVIYCGLMRLWAVMPAIAKHRAAVFLERVNS